MKVLTAMTIAAGMLAGAVPSVANGQIRSDSSRVVVASLDAMLGKPPFNHPAGKASTVCIDIQPARAWSQPTWTHDPAFVTDVRTEVAKVVKVSSECRYANTPTVHGSVLAASNEPAVSVTILSLKFLRADSAVARLDEARGGPGSRVVECRARRAPNRADWNIAECTTVLTRK